MELTDKAKRNPLVYFITSLLTCRRNRCICDGRRGRLKEVAL